MASERGAAFTPDLFRFLRELKTHNDRAWFQANKARYEASVLQPAVRFVAAVGPGLARISRQIVADPRPFGGSVARIYRDTRFSKDKSPYRTNVGIHFGHADAGNSDEHRPGFYLHLQPGESWVASGIWRPSPPSLKRIRDAIVADPEAWARVRKTCAPSGGESYARVPAGYPKDHRFAEDLRRKDFFASRDFKDTEVTAPGFEGAFVAACRTINPLNRFLADATGVAW